LSLTEHAEIVLIEDILRGDFEQLELEKGRLFRLPWGMSVSKLRVMGVVISSFISEDRNFARLTIFDGSGAIDLRSFEDGVRLLIDENGEVYGAGSILDVVARPRSWKEELYLQPIIVRKIRDPNYIILRILELLERRLSRARIMSKMEREAVAEGNLLYIERTIISALREGPMSRDAIISMFPREKAETIKHVLDKLINDGVVEESGDIYTLRR
jgi:RPA family protein